MALPVLASSYLGPDQKDGSQANCVGDAAIHESRRCQMKVIAKRRENERPFESSSGGRAGGRERPGAGGRMHSITTK